MALMSRWVDLWATSCVIQTSIKKQGSGRVARGQRVEYDRLACCIQHNVCVRFEGFQQNQIFLNETFER